MSIPRFLTFLCVAGSLSAGFRPASARGMEFAQLAAGYAVASDSDADNGNGQKASPNASEATVGHADNWADCPNVDCPSDDCCCACRHWRGGLEGTFLAPNFHRGILLGPGNENLMDFGWEAAPRIWLGLESCSGCGVRFRYWQLDAERKRFNIDALSPFVLLDLDQRLEMFDIDGELTRSFQWANWDMVASFGGRFGSLDRLVAANSLDSLSGSSEFLALESEANTGGITMGLELCRPLGIGSIEVFGALRVSPLWGVLTRSVNARENFDGSPSSLSVVRHDPTQLTIWEAQVGLQCSKCLACGQGTVFARCAYEYQSWDLSTTLSVADPSVDLYGVAVAIGLTR